VDWSALNTTDHKRSAEMADIVQVFKLQINILWQCRSTTGFRPGLRLGLGLKLDFGLGIWLVLSLGIRLGLGLELQILSL